MGALVPWKEAVSVYTGRSASLRQDQRTRSSIITPILFLVEGLTLTAKVSLIRFLLQL